jgi:hypothetical protein
MAKHHESSEEQRAAFGAALLDACERSGFGSSVKLAAKLTKAGSPYSQTLCSAWIRGSSEPRRDVVILIEQLTGTDPGGLSRHLGWLPVDAATFPDAELAILADPGLEPHEAKGLVAALRTLKQK